MWSTRPTNRPRPVDDADLAAAFERAAAGMALTDEAGVVLHANDALARLLGLAPAELVGRSVGDLVHPEDRAGFRSHDEHLARGDASHLCLEPRFLRAGGRPVWTRLHASVLPHAAGRRLLHVVDISRERETEERFREMTESIDQDFWLMALEPLRLLYRSPAAARIWGFDPMVNRDDPLRILEHIHPDDVGVFLELFADALERPTEREYRIVRGDGAFRWFRTRVAPMRNATGTTDRVAGITEDVTTRREAELELERHRTFEQVIMRLSETFVNLPAERLQEGLERALGETAPLFGAERATIFLMDERTNTLEVRYSWGAPGVDPGSTRFTDYSFAPDNPVRLELARHGVLCVEDVGALPDEVAESRARLLENGVGAFAAVALLRRGRMIGLYGCSTRARPTRWPPEIADRLKIAADLFGSALERVHAEALARGHQDALAHALRVGTMGQLAAGIAHELNQPLASILNYAQGFEHLLAAGRVDLAQLRDGARKITEQALRASDVIATFRALVRKGRVTRTWHDPNELVRTALRFIEPQAADAGARVTAEHAPNLPPVQVDPIQIEQVVLNLVRNAIDAVRALPDGARRDVRVVTRLRAPDTVEVSVSDGGAGVDAGRAEVVFDQFYTTKPDGLGLGLSISRSIIEAHGGRLWMDPRASTGATFRFTLSAPA